MRVIIADAAVEIQSEEWLGTVDILHVDLYDHEAAAPVLDDVAFYKNCRALLSDEGTMSVNLFGRTSSYEKSLTKMAEAFGQDALWAFKPTREGNTVVMAQRIASRPKRDQLQAQAEAIENRFGLPATKWLKVFKPLVT
jgi:spermidine synthase